jgi:hypothetical protein
VSDDRATECSKAERAVAAANYFKLGAAYWPGAACFSLVELDLHGNSIDAQPVCRACVREAALTVLVRLQVPDLTPIDLYAETGVVSGFCGLCQEPL